MYKRILTIQDISCVGQCSITVALPVLSSAGFETSILPTAILSTHTMGFKGFTFHNLIDEMPKIINHWKSENLKFDCLYTGYLGDKLHIPYINDIIDNLLSKDAPIIVDPVMADFGHLYPIFDDEYVKAVKELCKRADVIMPNITEASFLTGLEYKTEYDESYIKEMVKRLEELGPKTIILTGVSYKKGKTGAYVLDHGKASYYEHERVDRDFHGTGDVYSSTFVSMYLKGFSAYDAAKYACDFTLMCIKETIKDKNHTYGVEFEKFLYLLNK
ncbi:MAG: pyridoxamine kinase [Gammaproteobacteria bacterium]|nr:pyridoxamine kinase [Gammaproteobacteria bacterium]